MRAKKTLGQHFLMHAQTANRIVQAAPLEEGDTVLEIGPGRGILTRALLSRAKRVIAVEADADLIPLLEETFKEEQGLTLIHQDIRAFNPSTIEGEYAVVANIPYYITGEIIRSFLSASHKPRSLTLLVQKEVAVRIARAKKESLLSLSVKAYGTPHYTFTVPKGAFKPAPSVDSAVLTIRDVQKDAFASKKEEEDFFSLLHAGFAHKRKLLVGNLSVLAPKERVLEAFTEAHVAEKARAEDVPLSSWRVLAKNLGK